MAKKKCVICGKTIEDDSKAVPYKGRYVHDTCFNIGLKVIKQNKDEQIKKSEEKRKSSRSKPKAELKDALSEEDYQKKKQFFDYIHSYYYTGETLPAKVYVLADKYITQYGYTYESMYKTLVYIREIQNKEIKEDGIGLIPYISEEAKEYYNNLSLIEKNNQGKNISHMYKERTVIYKPRKKEVKQLDIENIGGD